MKDLNAFEKINPVITSAGYSLTGLAGCGIPAAVSLRDRLAPVLSGMAAETDGNDSKDKTSVISLEFRYRAINRAIEKTGIRNVLDLGCGFSPRPLELAELGYNVLGADLPAIIQAIGPVAEALAGDAASRISYVEVDATNAASLSDAADSLGDELIIVTEGLLPCLTESELWTVVENIRTTLLRHGGVWITYDFNGDLSGDKCADKDKDMPPAWMIGTDILYELHLKEDTLPFYDGSYDIASLSLISDEAAEACKDTYSACRLSVISEDDSTPAIDRLAALFTTQDGTLSIRHEIINGILRISLKGRLDSLTSKDLLDFYEEEVKKNSFRKIQLDFKELDYISSAGLRVLLIMYKGTPNHDVKLMNIGTEVFSVLEMTGYSDIFGL